MKSDPSNHCCILCSDNSLRALGSVGNRRFHNLPIHSQIPRTSQIYWCGNCGHTQKYHNATELALLKILYDNYTVGNFSLSVTQSLFSSTGTTGQVSTATREEYVVDRCAALLANATDILDIGCGTGSFLQLISARFPSTRLHAYEVTEALKEQLLAIPNVKSFSSGKIIELPHNTYDFIALWQCLEHLESPGEYLRTIHNLLRPNGLLLIQVPDLSRMPFDLSVFEHWSHFQDAGLVSYVCSIGFELVVNGREWIYNCSTVVFRKCEQISITDRQVGVVDDSCARSQLNWVNQAGSFF